MTGNITILGYGLAAIGPGIGVGLIFAAYINGVAPARGPRHAPDHRLPRHGAHRGAGHLRSGLRVRLLSLLRIAQHSARGRTDGQRRSRIRH